MAILRSVLGKFDQSMGDVTFTQWKGRNVAKQKVPSTNTSNSPAQQAQRGRFGLLGEYARLLSPLFRVGFNDAATTVTQYNVFVSRNFAATSWDGTDASIDKTQIQVASGNVLPSSEVEAVVAGQNITVTWADNTDGADGLATDKAYIGIINGGKLVAVFSLGTATREDGAVGVTLAQPSGWMAAGARCVIFFRRANSTATSESINAPVS